MSFQDVSKMPRWYKFTKTNGDLSAASTIVATALVTLPSGGVVNAALARVTQTFVGGSVSAATITVDAQGTGDIIPTMDVQALSVDDLPQPHYGNIGGTTVLGLVLTTVGDDTQNLTQGSIDIYLLLSELE